MHARRIVVGPAATGIVLGMATPAVPAGLGARLLLRPQPPSAALDATAYWMTARASRR